MNLENTKVYTTDKEVIRKYAELCGKAFFDQRMSFEGIFNSDTADKVYSFQDESPVDRDKTLSVITLYQINALYAEKFGNHSESPNSSEFNVDGIATETPEEAEAFSHMRKSHECEVTQPEWNGEGLPPVGAIYCTEPHFDINLLCKYSSKYVVVGEMLPKETYKGMEVVIDISEQRNRTFRKPETEADRKERELQEMTDYVCDELFAVSAQECRSDVVATVYAMLAGGYRKQKDGE